MILFTSSIFSESNSKGKWSNSLGLYSWYDAKSKCESIGRRLPTLDELKDAFSNKEMEKWNSDKGGVYWSSTNAINQNDGTEMQDYAMILSWDGYPDRASKTGVTKFGNEEEYYINLRCIRLNFKRKILKSGITWSEYLGEMDLVSAKKKCGELKMKLPSIKQFQAGIQARELEKWNPTGSYWVSDFDKNLNKQYTYYLHWTKNFEDINYENNSNHLRCVK
jgi:hypothetical protein